LILLSKNALVYYNAIDVVAAVVGLAPDLNVRRIEWADVFPGVTWNLLMSLSSTGQPWWSISWIFLLAPLCAKQSLTTMSNPSERKEVDYVTGIVTAMQTSGAILFSYFLQHKDNYFVPPSPPSATPSLA
jgi:hypothetical protein